jgi:hypothetical protein
MYAGHEEVEMIEQLFGSKTRVKLLQLFYTNPNRSFYVREITRKVEEQINSVRRELANLQSIGIITSDTSNNKVYYEVNQQYEYFSPLSELFGGKASRTRRGAKKQAPTAEPELLKPDEAADYRHLGQVEVLALMGQFTRDETSGVDVLVVGNVNPNAVQKYVTELEEQEGKDLRYTVFALDEFRYRLQIKDRFTANVLLSKKQVLVDKPGLLG